MRTIVIGDVHGCADALRTVLEKTAPAPEDTLVFLGDLFDRGPDSWEVFRTVRRLAEERGDRFVLLRGNHEDYLLQPKLSLYQRMIWDRVGRGETEKSFRAHGARMEDAVPWVREHCVPFWRGEGFQCVHAGLLVDPPEVNDAQTMFHDHEAALRNTYSGPLTIVGHAALEEPVWFAGDGETAETRPFGEWRTLPERGTICIDTGCGKGGRLTALTAEGKTYRLDSAE